MYAYDRNIFSLSRAGYYPHFLSVMHGRRDTLTSPLSRARWSGSGLTFLLDQGKTDEWRGRNLGAALLTMAVFSAVIASGAALVASVIALISLVSLFWNADHRPGIVGVAIYAVALAYFGIAGRHRLVLSPEEELAVTRGLHGHPELEGYGVTEREELCPGPSPGAVS